MLKPAFQSVQSGARKIVDTLNQEKLVKKSEYLLTWLGPAIGIPAMRYLYGDGKENRTEMLIRDGSTYMAGCAVFLAGKPALHKGLGKIKVLAQNKHLHQLTSFSSALTGYLLFSSLLAPRISKKLSKEPEKKPVNGDRFVKSQTIPLHREVSVQKDASPALLMAGRPEIQTPFAGAAAPKRPLATTNYFRGASPQWNLFR